jgi:Fe-S oxidoreductase
MAAWEIWLFRVVVVLFVGWFVAQMWTRYRLVVAAANDLALDGLPGRVRRFLSEVIFQSKVIAAKPLVGLAHLFVFWGFTAFGLYTIGELLFGLGIVDVTRTAPFHGYKLLLVPFSLAVLAGMSGLLVRRGLVRPPALGQTVSAESILIGFFIVGLMLTFLAGFRLDGMAARINWWVHMLIVLAFLGLIPNSKHLHLLISPLTVFLKSPILGDVANLDFEKEEVGLETVGDLRRKQVVDAFTCVECGRCQENCPAFATGKLLNPKKLILQNEAALLGGQRADRLVDVYDPGVLWQCTTCGACENQCPVGIEHLPLIVGARRGLVSNGEAPEYLPPVYNHLERRGNIWGLLYDQREKFVKAAQLEVFDPGTHDYLVWLGCAGAFEADFQRALRALFDILRARGVSFGVLAKERCTGDVAKRTGNEYLFQDLATQNIEELRRAGARKIVTSCPHCLKTLGADYRAFGFEAEVVHSSVLVAGLTREVRVTGGERVTFHDPCYLGRYAGHDAEPRELLERMGAVVAEPVRHRRNPFCCGAGGGLLFEEHEAGKRISQERFEQLQATGAGTIVMACPFCSIMLKGAQASANADVQMVDLMTYVDGRLKGGWPPAGEGGRGTPAPGAGTQVM